MSVIVTGRGFAPDDWTAGFDGPESADEVTALEIGPETDPETLANRLPRLEMLRIRFESFADGRGFTIARALRRMGYAGRLRAAGHVLADQYAMARRSGFDEIEIDDALAARQPEDQWLARADWRAHDYQSRLRG